MKIADILRASVTVLVATFAAPPPTSGEDRLRNIQFSAFAGPVTYSVSIPFVDPLGSSFVTNRLESIVRSGALADLAKVDSDRISIPAITVNVRAAEEMTTGLGGVTTLRSTDVVFYSVRDGQAAAITIGAISLETPWGHWTVENLAARKVDISASLIRYGMTPETRSGAVIEDMEFDVLHPGEGNRRTRVKILNLETTLAQFRNGIPTSFDLEGIGLDFDVPTNLETPVLAVSRAAGLTRFNGTFRLAAEWNESQERISIVEASLTEKTLGGAFLTGEILGAGKALFATAPDEASVAAADLAVRFLTLSIIDSGLGNRLAVHFAKSDSGDVTEQRASLARQAAQTVFGILHRSDDAGAVAAAVKRFVAEGGKGIVITAQAKAPPGINITEFLGIRTRIPAFLQRVKIDAEER